MDVNCDINLFYLFLINLLYYKMSPYKPSSITTAAEGSIWPLPFSVLSLLRRCLPDPLLPGSADVRHPALLPGGLARTVPRRGRHERRRTALPHLQGGQWAFDWK